MLAFPITYKLKYEFFGSLVRTSADFLDSPVQPLGLSFKVMRPSPPGGIALSKWAAVLPQPGSTFLISSVAVPAFLTMKS